MHAMRSVAKIPLRFQELVASNCDHSLWTAELLVPKGTFSCFVYCAKCALFASPKSVRGLSASCRGSPNVQRNARMFADGIHPLHGKFKRPWPLRHFCFATAEENGASIDVVQEYAVMRLPFDMDDEGVHGIPAVGHAEDSD